MKECKRVKLNQNVMVSIDYRTLSGTRCRTLFLVAPRLIAREITLRRFENEKV